MDYFVRIKELREEKNLKQQAIADYLHVGQTTYSEYERDIIRIPVIYLIELAKYYDVDLNYICGITSVRKPFPKDDELN